MSHLRLDRLGVSVGRRLLIDELNLCVEPGAFIGLVGPNGSGKSTLLKSVYRTLHHHSGSVFIDECDMATMPAQTVAREIAVVAQEVPTDLAFTVHEIVMLGRLPHQRSLGRTTIGDHSIVDDALDHVEAAHLADREWTTLSGGEKQRVLLARALAQQGNILVLDEPTNHLDISHQLQLLTLARSLGTTTVAALHDLNLAAAFCDEIVVLDHGAIVAQGAPRDVLIAEIITPIFGVTVDHVIHPRTGAMHLLFTPLDPPSQFAKRPLDNVAGNKRTPPKESPHDRPSPHSSPLPPSLSPGSRRRCSLDRRMRKWQRLTERILRTEFTRWKRRGLRQHGASGERRLHVASADDP